MKMKNRSHRYDIIRPGSRCGHEYIKYKKTQYDDALCIKQHLSKIWSSIHEKVNNSEAELKNSAAYKKSVYFTSINVL